jgi:hypothetical protein
MNNPLTNDDIDATLRILQDLLSEYEDSRLNLVKKVILNIKENGYPCQNQSSEELPSHQTDPQEDPWALHPSLSQSFQFWR